MDQSQENLSKIPKMKQTITTYWSREICGLVSLNGDTITSSSSTDRTYTTHHSPENDDSVSLNNESIIKENFYDLSYEEMKDKLNRFDEALYHQICYFGIPYKEWQKPFEVWQNRPEGINEDSPLPVLEQYYSDFFDDTLAKNLKLLFIKRLDYYLFRRWQVESNWHHKYDTAKYDWGRAMRKHKLVDHSFTDEEMNEFIRDDYQPLSDVRLAIERVMIDFEVEHTVHGVYITDFPRRAYLLAKAAHTGQVDKAGVDYIEHPKQVASFVATDEEKAVAFLHDTLEDTEVTEADLQAIGMPSSVIIAVKLLTHEKNQPYFTYLEDVKQNKLARTVKLADLTHNSDRSRLGKLTEDDEIRLKKYQKALEFLHN